MEATRDQYTEYHRERGPEPDVDVIVAHARPLTNAWVAAALKSVEAQAYPRTGLITVDNTDHALTLGAAWNIGVASSKAELVFFLREEDMLTADLLEALITFWHLGKEQNEHLVQVTSYMTLLSERNEAFPIQRAHTGMWERASLDATPWSEALDTGLEADVIRRMTQKQAPGGSLTFAVTHHCGYVWRNHAFRPDQIRTS